MKTRLAVILMALAIFAPASAEASHRHPLHSPRFCARMAAQPGPKVLLKGCEGPGPLLPL